MTTSMINIYRGHNGFEVWVHYDESADVWELFASEEANDYLGCADSLPEARKISKIIAQDLFNC